jgi:hypothetical protein
VQSTNTARALGASWLHSYIPFTFEQNSLCIPSTGYSQ